jgi:hypothetical protein
MQKTIQKSSNANREHMKTCRLKSAVITIALGVKKLKLPKVFVPAFAMMAIALGCIPAQSTESKMKIGVAMSNFDDVWLAYVRDAITKWASAHPDVQVTIVDGSDDTAKQVGQVENFLAQGMDAVVILPVDTSATGPVTKAVIKAGKPLVCCLKQRRDGIGSAAGDQSSRKTWQDPRGWHGCQPAGLWSFSTGS